MPDGDRQCGRLARQRPSDRKLFTHRRHGARFAYRRGGGGGTSGASGSVRAAAPAIGASDHAVAEAEGLASAGVVAPLVLSVRRARLDGFAPRGFPAPPPSHTTAWP